ncbi:MAG: DNA-processing protein DprA, partial [Pseudomonadota bacterium]|nr:DNA-processing protein DprA [Pseudomonadota bacterium]
MTDRDEIAAWLRLILTPQLGRESARQLLAGLGSAQGVWEASPGAWRDVLGARKAASIGPAPADLEPRIDATLAWLAGSGDRHFIVLGDPRYPTPLLHAPDPPLVLHAEGACERLGSDSIAIVGSRHPTPQGEEHARGFARHLGRAGLQVVSGLARGIDAAAHRGALEGSGGTVAVVGTGLDTVYPRCHARLAGDIVAGGGVMLSEYGLG